MGVAYFCHQFSESRANKKFLSTLYYTSKPGQAKAILPNAEAWSTLVPVSNSSSLHWNNKNFTCYERFEWNTVDYSCVFMWNLNMYVLNMKKTHLGKRKLDYLVEESSSIILWKEKNTLRCGVNMDSTSVWSAPDHISEISIFNMEAFESKLKL